MSTLQTPSDLQFASEFRYEYIFKKSSQAFTTSGGLPNDITIPIVHNLGYIPFFRLYFLFDGDNQYYGMFNGPGLILGNWEILSIDADTANITINLENFGVPAASGMVYYRIYAEPQS